MAAGSRLIIPLITISVLLATSVLGVSTTTAPSTSTRASSSVFPTGTAYRIALQMCWSKGSICSVASDFREECEAVEDAHGYDRWWECVCTSGLGAINAACDNCEDAYGIGMTHLNTTAECEKKGHTLAPIPSSILSQQSQHNATRATTLTSDTPTYFETIHATIPELPTITTTAKLPLDTGAASHQTAQYGFLVGGPFVAGLILAL
ncbi:hypothetical protein VTH82DRAFT_1589 [Thermothelomyces myriococcoides]